MKDVKSCESVSHKMTVNDADCSVRLLNDSHAVAASENAPHRNSPVESNKHVGHSVTSVNKWLQSKLDDFGIHFDSSAARQHFGDIEIDEHGLHFRGPAESHAKTSDVDISQKIINSKPIDSKPMSIKPVDDMPPSSAGSGHATLPASQMTMHHR